MFMKNILLLFTLLLSLTSSYAQEGKDDFFFFRIKITDTNFVPTTTYKSDGTLNVYFKQDSLTELANRYKFKLFEHEANGYPNIKNLPRSIQENYLLAVNDTNFVHELIKTKDYKFFISREYGQTDPRKKKALYKPNDQNTTPSGTYLDLINAPAAWDITKGDTSIHIGVTDVDFDTTHRDLQGKIVKKNLAG